MTDQTIEWLRGLAAKGGKGVVNNIDARSLSRIADEIESLRALAKCEECGNGPCESCMNTGYKHPDRAELALAAIEIAKLPASTYWLFAKGRTRPDEPLWAIGITDLDGNPIAEAEGNHPADVIRHAASQLTSKER